MKYSLALLVALTASTVQGYEILNDKVRTWAESQEVCQTTFGTDLAQINSDVDFDALTALCLKEGSKACWIGAHSSATDLSVWDYSDGAMAGGVTPWFVHESVQCAVVYTDFGGQWNDIWCDIGRAFPICESPDTRIECSVISSGDACMAETDCVWLPFTNPPRCGSMDRCEDNCAVCGSKFECVENGAGGNGACLFNSNTDVCFGALCDTDCQNCDWDECADSFAPPMGCYVDYNREDCLNLPKESTTKPTSEPTTGPTAFECSTVDGPITCAATNGCLWLPFTSPPRCGSMDKCEDNCYACDENECVSDGAGGNDACYFVSIPGYVPQCIGILCDNNCAECSVVDCENSFAPGGECYLASEEECTNGKPFSLPTLIPLA